MPDILNCLICSDILFEPIVLECNHTFCKSCITEWMKQNKNCPIDRTNVIMKKTEKNLFV